MYEQKHINLHRFAGDKEPVCNVAFYGDKVVATDSFRLVEMLASGEPHEPRLYDAKMVKAVRVPNKTVIGDKDFGLVEKEGSFPKYQDFVDNWNKEEYFEFAVNGDYLAEILSQLGKLAKYKRVFIKVPKKYADTPASKTGLPIILTAPDTKAYLMPMNWEA